MSTAAAFTLDDKPGQYLDWQTGEPIANYQGRFYPNGDSWRPPLFTWIQDGQRHFSTTDRSAR